MYKVPIYDAYGRVIYYQLVRIPIGASAWDEWRCR